MSKLSDLLAIGSKTPPGEVYLQTGHTPLAPVSRSRELERILALPRKSPRGIETGLPPPLYKRDGTLKLRPLQAEALEQAMDRRGLFAPIAVGGGKTLLSMLLPTVLEAGPTVILTSAGLVAQAQKMRKEYEGSFRIRDDIHWLSYGILSSPKRHAILEEIKPALIIADECHALAARDSARTKRFLRYMKAHPETLFCAMSGTVTKRSIRDFAHLLELALRDWTPLPRDFPTLKEWAEALDVSDNPRPVGSLTLLDPGAYATACDSDVERVRLMVRDRIRDTPGVVASGDNEIGVGLEIHLMPTPHCPAIAAALKKLHDTWETPDGDLITEATELARHARSLKLGAFSKWIWDEGVSAMDILEWKMLRRTYHSELREYLKWSRPGLDSPALVERAMEMGRIPAWSSWRAWLDVFQRVPSPRTEWRWVSDVMKNWASEWIDKHATGAIVWTDLPCFGRTLESWAKYYGEGPKAHQELVDLKTRHTIVASIKAHGVGKNLQAWDTGLIMGFPPTGSVVQQLLARQHREGQQADTVRFYVPDCFKRDLERAQEDARYIESTTGNKQKILLATIVEEG